MMRFERHAFVRLVSAPEGGVLSDPEAEVWRRAGLPFIVASSKADDPQDRIRLGLATADKRRVGFLASPEVIKTVLPPPPLREALGVAPPHWQEAMAHIVSICEAAELEAAVFGSLAWTMMSGRNFLHTKSDLDLLLRPKFAGPLLLRSALADLINENALPFRLDGEIILSDGAGVSIREYHSRPSELLLKAHGGARFATRADVDLLLQVGSAA